MPPSCRFSKVHYQTCSSWPRFLQVLAELEVLLKGGNPLFIVSNFPVQRFRDPLTKQFLRFQVRCPSLRLPVPTLRCGKGSQETTNGPLRRPHQHLMDGDYPIAALIRRLRAPAGQSALALVLSAQRRNAEACHAGADLPHALQDCREDQSQLPPHTDRMLQWLPAEEALCHRPCPARLAAAASLRPGMRSWRRGWDSNPRNLAALRFSRPARSTTLPPLRGAWCAADSLRERGRCKAKA